MTAVLRLAPRLRRAPACAYCREPAPNGELSCRDCGLAAHSDCRADLGEGRTRCPTPGCEGQWADMGSVETGLDPLVAPGCEGQWADMDPIETDLDALVAPPRFSSDNVVLAVAALHVLVPLAGVLHELGLFRALAASPGWALAALAPPLLAGALLALAHWLDETYRNPCALCATPTFPLFGHQCRCAAAGPTAKATCNDAARGESR